MKTSALLQWQKLIPSDVEFISNFERSCNDTLLRLNCEEDLVYRAQNFVNLAN